jgi:hypothetical protein
MVEPVTSVGRILNSVPWALSLEAIKEEVLGSIRTRFAKQCLPIAILVDTTQFPKLLAPPNELLAHRFGYFWGLASMFSSTASS